MHILEQEKNVRTGNIKNKILELFKEKVDFIDFSSSLLFVINSYIYVVYGHHVSLVSRYRYGPAKARRSGLKLASQLK